MNVRPPPRLLEGKIVLAQLELSKIPKMRRDELEKKMWRVLVSLISQAALNCLMPTKRIPDFVYDIVKCHTQVSKLEVAKMAKELFEELSLPSEILNLYPYELSGEMRQRIMIAKCYNLKPKLIWPTNLRQWSTPQHEPEY